MEESMSQLSCLHPIEFIPHPSTLAPELTLPLPPPGTPRDALFHQLYALEHEHAQLWDQFRQRCQYILGREYKEGDREQMMVEIKARNVGYRAQLGLRDMYGRQAREMGAKVAEKEARVATLAHLHREKQEELVGLAEELKATSDRLMQLKEHKTRLMDEVRERKANEGAGDSGVIDRLLAEYYETINQVMGDTSVNLKTSEALSELHKRKVNDMGSSFVDGRNP